MLDKLPIPADELEYVLDLVRYEVEDIPAFAAALVTYEALDLVRAVVLERLPTLTDEDKYALLRVKYVVLEIPAL